MIANSTWYKPSVLDQDKAQAWTGADQDKANQLYLECLSQMRGYTVTKLPAQQQSDWVSVDELDDQGDLIRASRLPLKGNGAIPWNVTKVRQVAAIAPTPKARAVKPSCIIEKAEPVMSKAIDVRFAALEQMIGAIAATVGDLAGAVAQIAASGTVDALPAVEALKSPEIAPVDWVGSYLDLVDEPVRAADELATASMTASVDAQALTVERDALAARVERLERALSVMAAGRRRQAKRARSEQGRAVNALAVAQESNAALVDERKRADAAESTLAQMKPIMDMLDAMRPAAPVAPIVDDGFCKPARGKARFAAMVQ